MSFSITGLGEGKMGFLGKISNLVIGGFLILLGLASLFGITTFEFYYPFAYVAIGIIILFMPLDRGGYSTDKYQYVSQKGRGWVFVRRWIFGFVLLAFGALSFFPDFLPSLGYPNLSSFWMSCTTMAIGLIYFFATFSRTRDMPVGAH